MRWGDIEQNPLSNLTISPLAMIPHNSRKYRAILDLSFSLKVERLDLPSVNKATMETLPDEALDQVGTVTPHIIKALAKALLFEYPIHFSKLDIKDGFWRMMCAVGE